MDQFDSCLAYLFRAEVDDALFFGVAGFFGGSDVLGRFRSGLTTRATGQQQCSEAERQCRFQIGLHGQFPCSGAGAVRRSSRALAFRSEEHTSELQSLMRNSYAV